MMKILKSENGSYIYKLFWIFMTGCVTGYSIETLYCFILTGTLVNRSSVLYGPFSIVWGAGAVIMSLYADIIYHTPLKNSNLLIAFFGGILGGVHEFFSSLLSEKLIGVINWNYSSQPYNIEGRTSLLFCVYWAVLSLAWVKYAYPFFKRVLDSISWNIARTATLTAAVLMILNIYLSTCALRRFSERTEGFPASSSYAHFLDTHYPDLYIRARYPSLEIVDYTS